MGLRWVRHLPQRLALALRALRRFRRVPPFHGSIVNVGHGHGPGLEATPRFGDAQ